MKTIRFRVLIAAMAVLLGTAVAKSQTDDAAAPPPPGPGSVHGHEFGMVGPMMHFWARQLDLTDEQKTQLKTVMEKERPVMKPLFEQSHQIDLQMRQYAEGKYDEAKVRSLATQKAQVEAELDVQKTRIHNELFQLLTPEQQTKMQELEAQHEAHMQRGPQAPPAPAEE